MTTETTLSLAMQRRDLSNDAIVVKRQADEPMRMSFPVSSETPIDRYYGTEVLSHAAKAVRMDRFNAGAVPLLFNHDWNDPIGMIDRAWLDGKRLWVDAHLFATDRAAEIAQMVDGGLRNVSIGYEVDTMSEDTKTSTYTATEWGVLEVSLVTVPADASVGIGRAADDQAKTVRLVREVSPPAARQSQENATMAETTTASAAEPNIRITEDHSQRVSASEAERQRRDAIINLGKGCKIDERAISGWVQDGTPMDKVALEILAIQEERAQARPVAASALGLSSREAQRYSLFKAIRAMHFGGRDSRYIAEAAFEMECSKEVAKRTGRGDTLNILVPGEVLQRPVGAEAAMRAMTAVPGPKGGYLVQTENLGFLDILRNRSITMNMGVRNLPGLVGNVAIPRQTGKPSVTWQAGENASVTAADQTLGQITMTPRTAICITDVSEQLLRQSSPSAEQFVMADLAANVAIDGVDNAVLNGTGGAQPLGIVNTVGITSGQDAASITYAKALAFVSTAAANNAIRGNAGFLTNAAGAAVCLQRQRFTSTDTPIWQGNIFDGELVGFKAMSSEQATSGRLVFGSWDEIVIGDWGVLELAMDTGGTRFNLAQVGIRAMWMVDVAIRYPQAFVVSSNLS
jgi:HK97 family phage major capsid protein/HK97 family phage prohead protease